MAVATKGGFERVAFLDSNPSSFKDRIRAVVSRSAVGDLVDAIREKKIGDAVDVEVVRMGRKVTLRTTLGTRPW